MFVHEDLVIRWRIAGFLWLLRFAPVQVDRVDSLAGRVKVLHHVSAASERLDCIFLFFVLFGLGCWLCSCVACFVTSALFVLCGYAAVWHVLLLHS